MKGGGFMALLGGGMPDEGPVDPEREAALAAMRRLMDTKDEEVALEAFLSLCRYAEQQDGGGMGGGDEGG